MKLLTREDALSIGAKHYFTGKPCKHGHIAPRFTARRQCLECNRLAALKRYKADPAANIAKNKKWKEGNRKEYLEKSRAYYQANKESVLAQQKKFLATSEGKAIKKARDAKYRAENKDRLNRESRERYHANKEQHLAYQREYQRRKEATDPAYRLTRRLRKRVWDAIAKGYKSQKTMELIGCSIEALMQYLEKQFTDGMTWDNYGKWHVDHIRPCDSFDLTDPKQQKQCFHFSNLQPLWAEDNIRKSNNWEPEAA